MECGGRARIKGNTILKMPCVSFYPSYSIVIAALLSCRKKNSLWNKDILLQPLNWQTNACTMYLMWCEVFAGMQPQPWDGSMLLQDLLSITACGAGCTKLKSTALGHQNHLWISLIPWAVQHWERREKSSRNSVSFLPLLECTEGKGTFLPLFT